MRAGDIICYESMDGIIFLKVQSDLLLTDVTQEIEVIEVLTGSTRMVPLKNLILDGSNILVIPSYLYKDEDGDFLFTSVAEEIFANIIDKRYTSNLTEEEWLVVCSVESSTNEKHVAEIRAPQRNGYFSHEGKEPRLIILVLVIGWHLSRDHIGQWGK